MTLIRTLGESWTLRQLGIKGNKGTIALDQYLNGQTNPDLLREGLTFCEMVGSMLDRATRDNKQGSEPQIRTALWREDKSNTLFEASGVDLMAIDSLLRDAKRIFASLLDGSNRPDENAITKVRGMVHKLSGALYQTDLENLRHFKQRRSLKACG